MKAHHEDGFVSARAAALILIPAVWAGLLAGVSFIATPVKFAAPSLELPVALDVGRVTFGLFSRIEWGAAAVLLAALLLAGLPRRRSLAAAWLVLLLALQGLWLLPALDARVALVIAGTPAPPSWHHGLYAGAELLKLVTLSGLALAGLRVPRRAPAETARPVTSGP